MFNYRMTVTYDGTDYNGWQKQGNTKNTIQGRMEQVLRMITDEDVEINGAGRTDAGVHALGQTANFKLKKEWDTKRLIDRFNHNLPDDICITELEKVEERFHSRLNAKGKIYVYRIQNSISTDVFNIRYMYHFDKTLNIEAMREAARYFVGEHDFKSFCSNRHMKKSTVRIIKSIDIVENDNKIEIIYNGNGFLYNMIRIITGTLIEVGIGKRDVSEMTEILKKKDRQAAGMTAPACGLRLEKIFY